VRVTHRRPWRRLLPSAAGALALTLAVPGVAFAHHGHGSRGHDKAVKRIVVIYEENHSFDNLYGGWEGVNGLANADAAHTTQVNQAGTPYTCLLQNDVNLTSPPLAATCHDATVTPAFDSAFPNAPFKIDDFIPATAKTCPAPGVFAPTGVPDPTGLPGGCTRDLVHRFYQEQYQLDGGKQDRYTTGSDAIGLTQGYYDTRALPIYKYLHAPGHPAYAIADDFFQAAFGGSFLNHQWLVAAATPTFPGATPDQHSVLDANGMPTSYPLYTSPGTGLRDTAVTAACGGTTPAGLACGDFAVNTIQPLYQPFSSPMALKLPAQTAPTIGDRLSAKGVDWAWYSGGWSNADGEKDAPGWTNGSGPTCSDPNALATATFPNCPDKLFQFHHQPLNYFASFAPGTAARAAHLRDEAEFEALAQGSKKRCQLKPVSFIKPIGEENEHPGYASEHSGSSHLVDLLTAIENSRCAKNTMVVVTYDEFGGQWDHVSPPGQGGTPGPHDMWGPSTRIPALLLSPRLRGNFVVDHTQYDTTSILATIEHRFGLAPLTTRDAAVKDLFSVFSAKRPHAQGFDRGHRMRHGPGPKRYRGHRD
jgi:acid phosphatase